MGGFFFYKKITLGKALFSSFEYWNALVISTVFNGCVCDIPGVRDPLAKLGHHLLNSALKSNPNGQDQVKDHSMISLTALSS